MTQKVIKVGSSAAVTMSKQVMKTLGIKIGDDVHTGINAKTGVFEVEKDRALNVREEHVAGLTLDVIKRYRKDLEALVNK